MTAPTIRPADELRPSRRLLEHLPGIYRQRDAVIAAPPVSMAPQPPLADLVGVIGRSLDALHDDIAALWDDHHVERAHPSALPLLAELFGVRLLSIDVSAQRALIARIVGWRRRKGTLLTLEDVLTETTTWDAEVDEGFRSVLATLDLAHVAPWRGRAALLWDPIAMADPLTRRAPAPGGGADEGARPRNDSRRVRGPVIAPLPGEAVDDTLRRLGRVDAGHHAASPRTLELRGWVRPDAVLIRTSRLVPVELENIEPAMAPATAHAQRRGYIDPAGRDTPMVWLHPVTRPDLTGGVTARHEPAADEAPLRLAAGLLTPSALAEDPDAAERAGAFQLAIDGVPVIGPAQPRIASGALAAAPVSAGGVVRFAEASRPSPGDRWRVSVIATLATGASSAAAAPAIDRLLIVADLDASGPIAASVEPGAGEEAHGRSIDLVIERLAGTAHRRTPAGAWAALPLDPRVGPPVSNAVALDGSDDVVRLERDVASGTNRLVRFTIGTAARQVVRTMPAPLDRADGIALVADGTTALAVTDTAGGLGVWSITDAAGAATIARLDAGGTRAPAGRESPSLCVHDGRLYVFGGDLAGAAAGDMWSLPLAGGPWRPHSLRRREERIGAALVSTPAGLALIGGDPVADGGMTASCRIWDVAASRAWRPLPPLPFDDLRPGLLIARATAVGLEVLAWADRTRPVRYTLAAGADAWEIGGLETGGPNPPAVGEALFAGDDVLVIGPPPLPASDVVFTQGDGGVLAVLPRLGLEVGTSMRLRVATTGATYRRDPPAPAEAAIPRPLDSRFGGLLGDALLAAPASDGRYAQPGRLSRRPWRLAQRSLGPWDALVATAVDDAGAVFLDPRLGRFVLPPGAPDGRITVSCRVGRGGALGPGLVPPGRAVPVAWTEPLEVDDPDLAAPTPSDLVGEGTRASERDPHAYVARSRAGQIVRGPEGGDIAVVADLESAHAVAPPGVLARLAVLGSSRVPFARLTAGTGAGLSVVAADPGSTPVIARDEERDLSLLIQTPAEAAPSIALAGLWLLGALDLAVERGHVDLRWCQIAGPGRRSVWAPGGGHQDLASRRSMPGAQLIVRLYGCQVGIVELPPWARLIAAGCTFDAGARDGVAIAAAGAAVRLRHCTVHGQTVAGKLEASSCAFAGAVRVDRDDLGFVRHSLVARDSRAPRQYQSRIHTVSMISLEPTSPGYLVLADNNGAGALAAGEGAALPGAFGERGDHQRELDARTAEFLPIGMDPVHVDRTTFDLHRLGRR